MNQFKRAINMYNKAINHDNKYFYAFNNKGYISNYHLGLALMKN